MNVAPIIRQALELWANPSFTELPVETIVSAANRCFNRHSIDLDLTADAAFYAAKSAVFTFPDSDAREIVLTDIYAASEEPIEGITLDTLADAVRAGSGRPVRLARTLDDVVPELLKVVKPGDAVITLGAGSIGTIPPLLIEALTR